MARYKRKMRADSYEPVPSRDDMKVMADLTLEAAEGFRARKKDFEDDPEDYESMCEMFEGDAQDAEDIAELLERGEWERAVDKAAYMDTSPREKIEWLYDHERFMNLPESV